MLKTQQTGSNEDEKSRSPSRPLDLKTFHTDFMRSINNSMGSTKNITPSQLSSLFYLSLKSAIEVEIKQLSGSSNPTIKAIAEKRKKYLKGKFAKLREVKRVVDFCESEGREIQGQES